MRGLIAGAVLLLLAGAVAAIGVFEVSDVAAAGTIVTLFVLCALVLFDTSWEQADATGDAPSQADPITAQAGSADGVADAGSTAA